MSKEMRGMAQGRQLYSVSPEMKLPGNIPNRIYIVHRFVDFTSHRK